jgi:hypothetical protein
MGKILSGLTSDEVLARRLQYGPNEVLQVATDLDVFSHSSFFTSEAKKLLPAVSAQVCWSCSIFA